MDGIPWESAPSLRSLGQTIIKMAFEPTQTFENADPDRTIGSAVLFALIMGSIGGLFGVLVQQATQPMLLNIIKEALPQYASIIGQFDKEGASTLVVTFIAVPLSAVLTPFITGGMAHLSLLIFGGRPRSFDATFRAAAYGMSLYPLQLIPMVGGLVSYFWGLYITFRGLAILHPTSPWKAAIAACMPLILSIGCLCCACGLFGALIGAAGTGIPQN